MRVICMQIATISIDRSRNCYVGLIDRKSIDACTKRKSCYVRPIDTNAIIIIIITGTGRS
jgi:hypothetical protein